MGASRPAAHPDGHDHGHGVSPAAHPAAHDPAHEHGASPAARPPAHDHDRFDGAAAALIVAGGKRSGLRRRLAPRSNVANVSRGIELQPKTSFTPPKRSGLLARLDTLAGAFAGTGGFVRG